MKSRSLFLIAMILTVLGTGPVLAQGKKGGGKTPPLPNVRYTLQSFYHPTYPTPAAPQTPYSGISSTNSIVGLNNWGECVGSYGAPDGHQHAWYYNPSTMSQGVDLNSIGAVIPSDCFIAQAFDINDSGEIVGLLRLIADPYVRRGFVLELRPTSGILPVLHELPDSDPTWLDTYARRINNRGDILGVFYDGSNWGAYLYNFKLDDPSTGRKVLPRNIWSPATTQLNNWGIVVAKDSTGMDFLSDGTNTTPLYSSSGITKINDAGTLCGVLSEQVQVRKNLTQATYSIYRDFGNGRVKIPGSEGRREVEGLNNFGTVFCDRSYIFQDEWGFIDLFNLLTGPIESFTGFLGGPTMNDAGPAGFGQIAGRIGTLEQPTYVLLTPYVPTP